MHFDIGGRRWFNAVGVHYWGHEKPWELRALSKWWHSYKYDASVLERSAAAKATTCRGGVEGAICAAKQKEQRKLRELRHGLAREARHVTETMLCRIGASCLRV
jgi:hypothetical protein